MAGSLVYWAGPLGVLSVIGIVLTEFPLSEHYFSLKNVLPIGLGENFA